MKGYRRILRYLGPYRGLFAVSVIAMIVFGALDAFSFALLIPFLDVLFRGVQAGEPAAAAGDAGAGEIAALDGGAAAADGAIHRLLDWAVGGFIPPDDPIIGLRNVVLVMFAVFAVKNVAAYVEAYTVVLIEQRVARDLRDRIFGHLLRLGLPFFQRTRTGQILSRMTHDIEQMRNLVTKNLAKALSCAFQTMFIFAILVSLSWKLTAVMLLAIPAMLGLWDRFRKRLHRGVLKVLDAVGDLASHIQERVSGIRLVQATGAERWEVRRFRALTQAHYKAVIRNERWRQLFPPATEMITAGAVLLLLLYGGHLVLTAGELEATAFLAFLGLAMRMMSPVKWLGHFPSLIQPGLAASERVFELLDTPPEVSDRPGARPVREVREGIRFENVGFAYAPPAAVLSDVDAEIPVGRVVALVGASGAGKSTVAALAARFYDPTSGRVALDGTDLRDLRLADLRGLMGIVSQETVLFHDTVRANIAYGLDDVAPSAVEEAARAANAHEFIESLPDGYDTILGERGTRLSGGQQQRIAIARALLRNPPILILDEATSALDAESERLVQEAVDRLLSGRTVLVIAHRLSTIRRADEILVLDRGRIVERGTHDSLLAAGGLYRHFYRLQFAPEDRAVLDRVAAPAD